VWADDCARSTPSAALKHANEANTVKYDRDKHHRRSIRLPGRDYSSSGAYFVTICTQDRDCALGAIDHGDVRLNDAGRMVARWWNELNRKFPAVCTDAFVVMPNHLHGIIVIGRGDRPGGGSSGQSHRIAPTDGVAQVGAALQRTDGVGAVLRDRPAKGPADTTRATLADVVQWFKTMTTNEYIRGVTKDNWPPFRGRFWQRNYHERIVRNDRELRALRGYIRANPRNWPRDTENPTHGQ